MRAEFRNKIPRKLLRVYALSCYRHACGFNLHWYAPVYTKYLTIFTLISFTSFIWNQRNQEAVWICVPLVSSVSKTTAVFSTKSTATCPPSQATGHLWCHRACSTEQSPSPNHLSAWIVQWTPELPTGKLIDCLWQGWRNCDPSQPTGE